MKIIIVSTTIIVFFILGFVVGIRFEKERVKAEALSCTKNLKIINIAKKQAAQELGLVDGDLITEEQIQKFCLTKELPTCPAGGTYSLNPIGEVPTCSLRSVDPMNPFHNLISPDFGEKPNKPEDVEKLSR